MAEEQQTEETLIARASNITKEIRDKVAGVVNRQIESGGAIVARYPSNIETADDPFILFTKHRAKYNTRGSTSSVDLITYGHVSLYMPMGFAINDQAVFETAATGLLGGAANALLSGVNPATSGTKADVAAVGLSLANQIGTAVGGGVGSLVPGKVGSIVGAITGAVGLGNIAQAAAQEINKQVQLSINPREFMLYKSPGMRNFSFRFRFIPDSEAESQAAEKIVEFFRKGMYPAAAGRYSFNFPDAFQIQIRNMSGLPKLPEVYLESCGVTYNPNSMSYFKQGNRPVEINLSLEFKEMQPITRENVIEGY